MIQFFKWIQVIKRAIKIIIIVVKTPQQIKTTKENKIK